MFQESGQVTEDLENKGAQNTNASYSALKDEFGVQEKKTIVNYGIRK